MQFQSKENTIWPEEYLRQLEDMQDQKRYSDCVGLWMDCETQKSNAKQA
jgi:hypothetical protein